MAYDDFEKRVERITKKLSAYDTVKKALDVKLGKVTKSDVAELCPLLSTSSIEKVLAKMVEEGKSVIMISSEMPELLGMCDRIYVMSEGRIAGEFTAEEATQERIMASIMQEQNKK